MLTIFIIIIVLFIIDGSIKTQEWLNCQGTQALLEARLEKDRSGWGAASGDRLETQKLGRGLGKEGRVASGLSP